MRRVQVEDRLRIGGAQIPEAEGVVEAGGYEGVVGGGEVDGRDGSGVATEVAKIAVVMRREVADCILSFLSAAAQL